MTIPSEILELWQEHSSAAFPTRYHDKVIGDVNLPLLDAEIAGYIRMYVNGTKLDFQKVETLREHLIDLNTIVLWLGKEEFIYFNRLSTLANLILQEWEAK